MNPTTFELRNAAMARGRSSGVRASKAESETPSRGAAYTGMGRIPENPEPSRSLSKHEGQQLHILRRSGACHRGGGDLRQIHFPPDRACLIGDNIRPGSNS